MHNLDFGEGKSDPISYTCSCSATEVGGAVLLFYRYWSNTPKLPPAHREKADKPELLAEWHRGLTVKLNLRGKFRIAKEGYNITVGGTRAEINEYMKLCLDHWSFDSLQLDTEEARLLFFKPSNGCACVFGPDEGASVRVTAEITPMGVEGYSPRDWGGVEALLPEEFHIRCHEEESLLLDMRNHYESRIGYFISPQTGEAALRPPIRRFSQWPQYLRRHKDITKGGYHRHIMTYCTGGIRCEKGARWMHENLEQQTGEKIYTLHGGIAAYLTWMDEEIRQGRKQIGDSLFRGRNYVFDARGSTGLSSPMEPVGRCHVCTVPTESMSKCGSKGCHLILVICSKCDEGDSRCCPSCHDLDSDQLTETRQGKGSRRPICACEQAREEQLWGSVGMRMPKTSAVRKKGPS
jgi:predicted sulfurtransferase